MTEFLDGRPFCERQTFCRLEFDVQPPEFDVKSVESNVISTTFDSMRTDAYSIFA